MKTFDEMLIESSKITNQNPVDQKYHSANPKDSIRKIWFFDVQWSDCPNFVEKEVRKLWADHELGNDGFIYKYNPKYNKEFLSIEYPYIYGWFKHKGVENEEVVIHWWW